MWAGHNVRDAVGVLSAHALSTTRVSCVPLCSGMIWPADYRGLHSHMVRHQETAVLCLLHHQARQLQPQQQQEEQHACPGSSGIAWVRGTL